MSTTEAVESLRKQVMDAVMRDVSGVWWIKKRARKLVPVPGAGFLDTLSSNHRPKP
jgi:dihydroneopterin aldolase